MVSLFEKSVHTTLKVKREEENKKHQADYLGSYLSVGLSVHESLGLTKPGDEHHKHGYSFMTNCLNITYFLFNFLLLCLLSIFSKNAKHRVATIRHLFFFLMTIN